jgi:hypothetical protein
MALDPPGGGKRDGTIAEKQDFGAASRTPRDLDTIFLANFRKILSQKLNFASMTIR